MPSLPESSTVVTVRPRPAVPPSGTSSAVAVATSSAVGWGKRSTPRAAAQTSAAVLSHALAALGAALILAGCSHAPTVDDDHMATLSTTQLTSVHADEATLEQAQQSLAEQEKEREEAEREKEQATEQRGQVKDAIDAKQEEIDARKKEKDQLEQQLETADAHVDAADARIDWVKARIESAQAEIAHQQALLEQAKFQALVKAKDPSVQEMKAEDFAERVRQTAEKAQDARTDVADAQKKYDDLRSSWQSQAQKD